MDYEIIFPLAIALGLGLLVGLQREYADHEVAGIRTFPLITLLGSVMAMLGEYWDSPWPIAVGLLAIAILLATINYLEHKEKDPDIGQTTEMAILLMYGIGAYLVIGDKWVGVAVAGVTAVLLHLKGTLGDFVEKLAAKDIRAIMQFVAISLVILPLLPNDTYGPYDVFNPHETWLMVVLIVGLGLAGYFIYKWVGKDVGSVTSGILGGMISSTATTVTYSRRTKDTPDLSRLAAFIIMTASTIALVRIIVEVAFVSPNNLGAIAPPLVAELVFMIILCVGLYFYGRKEDAGEIPEPDNPAQLKSALIFGGLYAVILIAVAAAKDLFGDGGLLAVSIVSGLTDVDAITLSLANTLNRGGIETTQAWQYMLIASLSNLVFKGGMAVTLGTPKLAKFLLPAFGLSIAAGLLIVLFWPG